MAYSYNNGSRSDQLVKKMIPIMVLWAKHSWTDIHTYKDLQEAMCIDNASWRLGLQLGYIDDIFKHLSKEYGQEIPTLNALVCNKHSKLPSKGLNYVFKDYDSWESEKKRIFVRAQNQKAHEYDYSWVLEKLGLQLPTMLNGKELVSARKKALKRSPGGEGPLHKRLKEYIASTPSSIGMVKVINVDTEYPLLSGDKLDIRIETQDAILAVEIKSAISDEDDIRRGIYQCVKYKALLHAEEVVEPHNKKIETLLVIEGDMPPKLEQTSLILGIKFIDKFSLLK